MLVLRYPKKRGNEVIDMTQKYTDWYIDPSYSNTPTIWKDGFALCLVEKEGGKWSVQAYDERNGSFSTGEPMLEMECFDTVDEAKAAAESKLFELER